MTQTGAEQPPLRTLRQTHAATLRLLAAVLLAIGAGLLLRHVGPRGLSLAHTLGQFGQLWLNALQMTLIPLIFCLMTAGVAKITRTASGGKVLRIALTVFTTLLVLGSVLGALTALGLLAIWPVSQMSRAAAIATTAPPSLLTEFISFVPANPIASAAEGAVAPLIVFAAFLGAAITQLKAEWTALLLEFLNALSAAMLLIVGWVLRFAPFGIFFLLLGTVATTGTDAAKGLLQYGILASVVTAIGLLAAELVGVASGVGPGRFARAAIPAQTLAATTQSSSACLPVLLQAATVLALPDSVVSAIMPLAVTTFRFGNVVSGVATGLFGAALYGVHPTATQIAVAIGIGILTNIGSVGVPGAAVLLAAWGPIYLALGAPLEALTLFIAVITVPDILITLTNVTGDLAAASVISTLLRKRRLSA